MLWCCRPYLPTPTLVPAMHKPDLSPNSARNQHKKDPPDASLGQISPCAASDLRRGCRGTAPSPQYVPTIVLPFMFRVPGEHLPALESGTFSLAPH